MNANHPPRPRSTPLPPSTLRPLPATRAPPTTARPPRQDPPPARDPSPEPDWEILDAPPSRAVTPSPSTWTAFLTGALSLSFERLPAALTSWILAHPKQTAFILVNGVVWVAPGAVTAGVLGVWGGGTSIASVAVNALTYVGVVPRGGAMGVVRYAAKRSATAAVVYGAKRGVGAARGKAREAVKGWWRGDGK